MISQWKVIQAVADRYGDREDSFVEAFDKLSRMREGKIPLVNLEENKDRVQKRLARERMPLPFALERINGIANFQDKNVLDKLSILSQSVCRLLKGGTPIGTGFLVADGILMTNHHVIGNTDDARDMLAEFDFELDLNQAPKNSACFRLNAGRFFLTSTLEEEEGKPFSGLDFTLIAVDNVGTSGESLSQYKPVLIDGNHGKIIKGESCVIIQHPKGLPKKIVLKDTAFFSETGTRIVYESDTLPGSSGSMVVGLGTCEIIALHHSGLPRTDAQNRVLTRSGAVATADTPDEEIDWIGNEGIKISKIVEAIQGAALPATMEPYRALLLRKTQEVAQRLMDRGVNDSELQAALATASSPPSPVSIPQSSRTAANDTRDQDVPGLQYFEVLLADKQNLRDDWEQKAPALVKGLVETRPLFSAATTSMGERMQYVTVRSGENPWTLAAAIENLPHVESCTPDLEVYTDIGVAEQQRLAGRGYESAVVSDGTAEPNETEFIRDWQTSPWFQSAANIDPKYYRWWNWLAVNCPEDSKRNTGIWSEIVKNLPNLRYVQLDTGYTHHSKSFLGYDLDKDFDFIDSDSDAEDRIRDFSDRFLLKHPSHGTRTASLTIGNKLVADPDALDGNSGLLTFQGQNPVRLIPYRIAKSVILLGRGKEMVSAASYAIQNGTDVMFMCMGSYPRPMIEAVAREAYVNGVIWVCAAGNEVELVVAPAMYPGTIAVAAVNPGDLPWKGSSNGEAVDIAAPGESVYVPFADKHGKEIMVYGHGTSYATPHVASAAMMWKAKHFAEIREKYKAPWQVVEAFRSCLKESARQPGNWTPRHYDRYGAGILDIGKLLETPLPAPEKLKHAYEGVPEGAYKDLGIKEAAHYLWNVIKRKVSGGPMESIATDIPLTERGRKAMASFVNKGPWRPVESAGTINQMQADDLLRDFFEQN